MPHKRKSQFKHQGNGKPSRANRAVDDEIPDTAVDVEIDGSQGEGGGQIVRAAVALACVLDRSVRVRKVRYSRSKPGLQAQHSTGVQLTAKLAGAQVHGAKIGSTTLLIVPCAFPPTFEPGETLHSAVGTAGAISLVLQACLPVALRILTSRIDCTRPSSQQVESRTEEKLDAPQRKADRRIEVGDIPAAPQIRVTGGTTVAFSPSSDYVRQVLVPNLRQFGICLEYEVDKDGFFPRGGGQCSISLSKADCYEGSDDSSHDPGQIGGSSVLSTTLRAVTALERGAVTSVHLRILTCGRSADECAHIAERMRKSVTKQLGKSSLPLEVHSLLSEPSVTHVPDENALAMTACVTLYAGTQSGFTVGVSALWSNKDVPRLARDMSLSSSVTGIRACVETAGHVAERAAQEFCDAIEGGAVVDKHMADQLVMFMAMAQGVSKVLLPQPTLHMRTVVDVLQDFGVQVELCQVRDSSNVTIVCHGQGIPLRG